MHTAPLPAIRTGCGPDDPGRDLTCNHQMVCCRIMGKIVIENLSKIFGPQPEAAMQLLRNGLGKDAIHQQTGMTVGVDDVSFTVRQGEIFVVMGLSGSGKSTLVRMLNRLIEPTAGEVIVDGRPITRMRPAELVEFRLHNMSMVFQSFALMPHMTVVENAADRKSVV